MKIERITNPYDILLSFGSSRLKYHGHVNKLDYRTFLPEDLLIRFCQQEQGIALDKWKLRRLVSDSLIQAYKRKGEAGNRYPLHTLLRIQLIERLRTRAGFSLPILQQIFTFENLQIQKVIVTQFYESTFNRLTWAKRDLRQVIENDLPEAKRDKDEEFTAFLIDVLNELKQIPNRQKLGKLSSAQRKILEEHFEETRMTEERTISDCVLNLHDLILKGYSPHIVLTDQGVDWKKSALNIKQFPFLSYFSTPDFRIDFNSKDALIAITKPHRVKSIEMRGIERIYTAFLDVGGIAKQKWGERSGLRIRIQDRDNKLRETYRRLRRERPRVSSALLIENHLKPMCDKIGLPASFERIQRIIYTSK